MVRHGTRHGVQAVPKLYRPKDGERPVDVMALEFCPTGEPFFLVRISVCVGLDTKPYSMLLLYLTYKCVQMTY